MEELREKLTGRDFSSVDKKDLKKILDVPRESLEMGGDGARKLEDFGDDLLERFGGKKMIEK